MKLNTLATACVLAISSPAALAGTFCGATDYGLIDKDATTVRFATFNASMNRSNEGDLVADLSMPGDPQISAVAEIIQRTRPDVLLINEFDYVADGMAADLFRENYLEVSQNGALPVRYRYAYVAESNTGIPSGLDLDNDGATDGPGDAFGFGFFPGQYGMLLLSRYPIVESNIRSFQNFLWKDMPGALLPDDPATEEPADWYSAEELDVFRLSSKSHWDIPLRIDGETVHVLASHPTPPVFDGDEDRNGTRNHDEIRFWADYIGRPRQGRYIYDDSGRHGGLAPFEAFVIMGDLNADPNDGDSTESAILQLLDHPNINSNVAPASFGAAEAAVRFGGENEFHVGPHELDTGDFNDAAPGNLRVDYVLPSKSGLDVLCGGVYWPRSTEENFGLVGDFPFPSSDHRLVWMDLEVDD